MNMMTRVLGRPGEGNCLFSNALSWKIGKKHYTIRDVNPGH